MNNIEPESLNGKEEREEKLLNQEFVSDDDF
jgi:hypothetical protein